MKRSVLKPGKAVSLSNFSGSVRGKFVGIGPDGSLVLSVRKKEEKFFAGDVTIL